MQNLTQQTIVGSGVGLVRIFYFLKHRWCFGGFADVCVTFSIFATNKKRFYGNVLKRMDAQ